MGESAATTSDPGAFVHLHLHSEYSLLDGGNRVEELVARVAELGMKAVAVTDHGNLFGAAAFYLAAKEKGIRPILGVEAYVTPPGKPRTDRTYTGGGEGGFHLVLLAQSLAGWRNLMKLASSAYLEGFYYKPRIDREILAAHSEGLIAINGHLGSEIGEHLLAHHRTGDGKYWDLAVESARWHAATFSPITLADGSVLPRFYVELQHHVPEQNAINPLLIRLARELGQPLVCDNDAHFLRAEDHDAHDTLICISTGKGKNDDQRMRYSPELYVKSPAEMEALFEAYGEAGREALANTRRIAAACDVTLPLGQNHAPAVRIDLPSAANLPTPDEGRFGGDLTAWYAAYCAAFELKPFEQPPSAEELAQAKKDCDAALRMLAEAGYVWRYGTGTAGTEHAERRARMERELKILADKNISAYFLIVWDFVNWGRQRGIPANARGSGVGTMVGYVLGLSNACPVRYGLLFERFTDPDRSEYPDIDIDLCQDGRAEVIDYVRRKYGHVAQIITFGTLKARAAIRDVGRVLEMPLPDVDKVAKLVPETLGIEIKDALEQEPDLRKLRDSDPRVAQLLDNAIKLEGHTRHAGVHAAGVIVATRPLDEIVPLYRPPGTQDTVTQWDGPTCEKFGLLKMDFLGLRTLSIIERCKKLIRETISEDAVWGAVGRTRGGAHPLDLDRLTYDDQNVFELFRRGETTGVFQFESGGMRRLLVEMKPDRLEDLIAANALFRPGPMDLIPDYNRRKHGTEPVPTVHEIVDRYTAETYGVMVYQEQVMQIVHGLGGIKLRDAYTLIKNISKKKHDKIEKERPKFVDGAQKQGLTREAAQELFELILKFAGYGFNKSHSTGYAIVAYQTAYLKTYFPAHYMAAFLTYESQASKVSEWIPYLEDCRKTRTIDPATGQTVRAGVEVRPPDVNLSAADFTVVYEPGEPRDAAHGHVRFGLKAIKGAGDKAIEAIIREREAKGGFESLHDFFERLPPGAVNKATAESLIKCGALDGIHGRDQRAAMVASLDAAITTGQKLAKDKAAGQGGLFFGGGSSGVGGGGGGGASRAPTTLARATPWPEAETLAFEKEVLGFYVSSHPLDRHRAWASVFATASCASLKEAAQDARVILPAMVQSVRTVVAKNGKSAGQKMGILTVEDLSGACDVVMFVDCFQKYGHLAEAEKVVFVLGRVDKSRGDAQIIVDRLAPIEGVPLEGGRVRLFFDALRHNGSAEAALERVVGVLQGFALRAKSSGGGVSGNSAGGAGVTSPGGLPRELASAAVLTGVMPQVKGGPLDGASLFPVEVVIGTEDSTALLSCDPSLRVPLEPALVASLEPDLGAGMVRLFGGVAMEKERPKPWEKRKPRSDDDE